MVFTSVWVVGYFTILPHFALHCKDEIVGLNLKNYTILWNGQRPQPYCTTIFKSGAVG